MSHARLSEDPSVPGVQVAELALEHFGHWLPLWSRRREEAVRDAPRLHAWSAWTWLGEAVHVGKGRRGWTAVVGLLENTLQLASYIRLLLGPGPRKAKDAWAV
jgi:hypothetical protein